MPSIADAPISPPVSVEGLWTEGDVFAQHPRVRSAWVGDTRVTVHHCPDGLPVGIRTLQADSRLADRAGLVRAEAPYYVMRYWPGRTVDGMRLDELSPAAILDAIDPLWQDTFHAAACRAERPVRGPMTREQYVSLPDAVARTASRYDEAVRSLVRALEERPRGAVAVHGDLKADNLVVGGDGRARLIDWECCGAGHPEDDLASLLASLAVYAVARAGREAARASTPGAEGASLQEAVGRELAGVQRFAVDLLARAHDRIQDLTTDQLGHSYLLSLVCRLQGLQFVATPPSLTLAVGALVDHSMRAGPHEARAWLRGTEEARC